MANWCSANSFFHGVTQFNWCHWHSAAHRNISKKFVLLWAWKQSKTEIIWETRKLIKDGIQGLPVSWQPQCHGALGRLAYACKCVLSTDTSFSATGECCYSRMLMNATRIASTAGERQTAGDSCAGAAASQAEAIRPLKGPNPGPHPLDANRNRVPVMNASLGPRGLMASQPSPCPCSYCRQCIHHVQECFYTRRVLPSSLGNFFFSSKISLFER